MPHEPSTIRTVNNPTIVLDELSFPDFNSGAGGEDGEGGQSRYAKWFGATYPLVVVNNYHFSRDEIKSFVIDCDGFLPRITMSMEIEGKPFMQQSMPRDGDVAAVYLRSKNDTLKPLRNDYEITMFNANRKFRDNGDSYYKVYFEGKLRVPMARAVKCFSIEDTSYRALMQMADDLQLGFASNITETNDKQAWICPNIPYDSFMSKMASHAWKDDKAFFTSFIDIYYMLNFIDVSPMLSEDKTLIEAAISIPAIKDYTTTENAGKPTVNTKLILSNHPEAYPSSAYIEHYQMINNSTAVSQRTGYKQFVHFYDKKTRTHQAQIVDPLMGENAENEKIILRGRPNEDFYKDQVTHIWKGIQYTTDNVHTNYYYAQAHSSRNWSELDKLKLKVRLTAPNFNITKYSRIPAYFFIYKDIAEIQAAQTDQERKDDDRLTLDRFMSGWYVVTGMSFHYRGRDGKLWQELTLSRREWPTPSQAPESLAGDEPS
jgi:hypothetical protein